MSTHSEIVDLQRDLARHIDRLKRSKDDSAQAVAAILENTLTQLREFEPIAKAELEQDQQRIRDRHAAQALDELIQPSKKKKDWSPHDI